MAFQTLSKRITDIDELALIFTFITFLFSIITLIFSQWAFSKADANIVVPSFTSASIILSSFLGITVIGESLAIIQYIGIGIIIFGIIFMTGFRKITPLEELGFVT